MLVAAGASPATVAASVGVDPYRILTGAVPGFAAVMDQATETSLSKNPTVVMTTVDAAVTSQAIGPTRFRTGAAAALDDSAPVYPPVTSYPSFVPTNVMRIGVPARAATERLHVTTPVAILDTGVQPDNPDLNVVGGVNCSDDPGGYGDDFGHGTSVAGVLAAKDNSFGTVGIAPGAPIYSVKVLDSQDSGEDSNIICGINWMAAHSGIVRVANMSLVEQEDFRTDTYDCGRSNHDAVHYAICAATKKGVIFVAAAGNDAINNDTSAPSGYPEVITVSGLSDTDGKPGGHGPLCDGNADDVFAQFSDYGRNITVAAVATCITTDYNDGTLIYWDGTSFAAPEVTGAAALMLEFAPHLNTNQIKAALKLTAEYDGSLAGDPIKPAEGVLNVAWLWRLLEVAESKH